MFNGPTERLIVHSAAPAKVVVTGDTLPASAKLADNEPSSMTRDAAHIAYMWRDGHRFIRYSAEVRRSRFPLEVEIADSTGAYFLYHRSRLDNIAWMNVLNYGYGLLVDAFHPRGYSFPDLYFANGRYATPRQMRRELTAFRGNTYLTLGFLWPNFFNTAPDALERRSKQGGFVGLSLGVEHFYADRRSVAVEASAIAGGGWGDEFNDAINLALTHNHHSGDFSLGYGINYSQAVWRYSEPGRFMYEDDFSPLRFVKGVEFRERRWKMGAVLNAYYKIGPYTRLGVVYRPSFYRFGASTPWAYEHSISIDLKFNIHLARPVGRPIGR